MPYKLAGKRVMIYKGGRWRTAPGGTHKTRVQALRHLRAIKANVKK